MLRERDLVFSLVDDELVAHWLTDRDRPWLRRLCATAESLVGLPRAEAERRLRTALPGTSPLLPAARTVLSRELVCRPADAPAARHLRQRLCHTAARLGPAAALQALAAELRSTPADLQQAMLRDLPRLAPVQPFAAPPDPSALALRINREQARAFLRHASSVHLRLWGESLAVLRTLALHGMPRHARQPTPDDPLALLLPGPRADPPRARRLARALAALVPMLPWCHRYRLQARVHVQGRHGNFVLQSGDPLPAGPPPSAAHSVLERRFRHDLLREAPDWDLIREPLPVAVGARLSFPDFALRRRPDGPWHLLEIAGYWTADYLAHKLALLAACPQPLLLCIEARSAARVPAAVLARRGILVFGQRLPVAAVLQALAGLHA